MLENTHGEEIASASGCKSHLDASRSAPEISDIHRAQVDFKLQTDATLKVHDTLAG